MNTEGPQDFLPAYSDWFGKPVLMLVVILTAISQCHAALLAKPPPKSASASRVGDGRAKKFNSSRGRIGHRCRRPLELKRPLRPTILRRTNP